MEKRSERLYATGFTQLKDDWMARGPARRNLGKAKTGWKVSPASAGFTLFEVIIVIVLLAILAATAVPKFFDLRGTAELKAARSAVAEAQSRLNTSFTAALLKGKSCEDALSGLSTLKALSDDPDSGKFGNIYLSLEGDAITAQGTAVDYALDEKSSPTSTGASIYLPACSNDEATSISASQASMNKLIERLIKEGNFADGGLHTHGVPVEQRTELLQNGAVKLVWSGISGNPGRLSLNYSDASGKQLLHLELQGTSSGPVTISLMNLNNTNYIHGSYMPYKTMSESMVNAAKSVLNTIGLNTAAFANILQVGKTPAEIKANAIYIR